ncbi:two-component system sensor histidine kinase DesK [Amycolatopsis echigonensis]|uniref:Two-component system sensor histidine kinase DesK n=1 Tax=Amycolatopsis echigonensis TaxID=2576905 RepID=A0A2N3WC63_9PSEU|nr:sensor histidine kinase [Amycolatopsis niigatensis]PKV91472.1 two-component system sensor histidine kinase DesK [Amycolatopsis niigatensis]
MDRGPDSDAQRWVLGWRRLVLDAGLLVYPLIVLAQTAGQPVAVVVLLAFCACYIGAAVAAYAFRSRLFWILTGVLTALFAVVLPIARANAFYLLAVVVSLAVPRLPRWGVVLVPIAAAATVVVPWAVWHTDPGWAQAAALVFTVLVVVAFAEALRANRALVQARAEVQRLAADAERSRISRDLHDLLGHSLTAITVKSNLARRLAAKGDGRAVEEIGEVEQLSRQALADVRAAVSGYREVTLAGELARGRELLRAAGISAELPTAADGPHQELFGWVVREGLTNVVRHSRATSCAVIVSGDSVEIRDDGVGSASDPGNGLSGLRDRVAAAGGRMDAGPVRPRGWRLRVTVGEA